MVFMRCAVTRSSLVKRRYHSSLGYTLHGDHCNNNVGNEDSSGKGSSNLLQRRFFNSSFNNFSTFGGFNNGVFNRRCAEFFPSACGVSFSRHMSTTVGGDLGNNCMKSDVAEVVGDATVQTVATQAPVVNEVAIAAADSFPPVQVFQQFIDAVHSYTGFNWWSSILVATLLIRTLMIPLVINQTKSTVKLSLLRPRLIEIQSEVQEQDGDPTTFWQRQEKIKKLYQEHGVTPFDSVKGLFFQAPVFLCVFLAITNMAEKVASFKNGGAAWFLDLTARDSLFIFPVLTALTIWLTVELSRPEDFAANPNADLAKKLTRIFSVLSIPLTMNFPNALFCYWIPSNLFTIGQVLALKSPVVKKALGIPEAPATDAFSMLSALNKAGPADADATKQPAFSLLSALKQARQDRQTDISDRVSSSSLISQRLKRLERQAKVRNKKKM